MIKKRTLMLLVAVVATVTSLMAQPKAQRQNLTTEQQEQIKAVKDQYAPKLKEIRDDMHQKSVEQKVLLSSKTIDEKTVYANIDAISELKVARHNEMTAMHTAMTAVCPNAATRPANGRRMNNQGQKSHSQGQGMRQDNRSNNKGQGMQKGNSQKKNGQGQMTQGQGQGQGQGMRQDNRSNNKGQGMQKGNAQKKNGQGHMAQGQRKGQGNGQHQQGFCANGSNNQGLRNGAGQGLMLGENCNMTDAQKATLKEVNKKHFWGIQETQNELALLKAGNTTFEERNASFAEVNALQTKLAKQKMALKLEVISNLTEDQRIIMMNHKGHNKNNGKKQGSSRMHKNRS